MPYIILFYFILFYFVSFSSTGDGADSLSAATSLSSTSYSSHYNENVIKSADQVASIGVAATLHTLMSDNRKLEGCNDYLKDATWL